MCLQLTHLKVALSDHGNGDKASRMKAKDHSNGEQNAVALGTLHGALSRHCCHPHFTQEETEAQRVQEVALGHRATKGCSLDANVG